jgi:hypothetical protein
MLDYSPKMSSSKAKKKPLASSVLMKEMGILLKIVVDAEHPEKTARAVP